MSEQAMKEIRKEIYLLIHKAEQMLELTEDAFMKNKTGSLDQAESLAKEIRAQEDALTEKLAKMAASRRRGPRHSVRSRAYRKDRCQHRAHHR